jgi:hypothetical protein
LGEKEKAFEELIIERDQFLYDCANLRKENKSYNLQNNKIMTERDQLAK